jgi:hypothetical protein
MENFYLKDGLDSSKLSKTDLIAYLGPDCTLDVYIGQYRLAINVLIIQVEQRKIGLLNAISLPLLFMIRHVFELISKRFIFWFERRFDARLPELKLDINSHKISLLSEYQITYYFEFMKHIPGKVEKGILRSYIQAVRDLSKILILVDNESYQLRYHINKNKMSCFDGGFQINCKDLLENYYKYLELGYKIWGFTDYFPDPEYNY